MSKPSNHPVSVRSGEPVPDWSITGSMDPPSVDADWMPVEGSLIHGVAVKEILNVPTGNGTLTEVYRSDWGLDDLPVSHVFQRVLLPGGQSAWHAHHQSTDRLFCAAGQIRLALYDGRASSPSHGTVWDRIFGQSRPLLVVIPPGVWHGVQTLSDVPATIINVVDRLYDYEAPDHWRLPADTPDIPCDFFK